MMRGEETRGDLAPASGSNGMRPRWSARGEAARLVGLFARMVMVAAALLCSCDLFAADGAGGEGPGAEVVFLDVDNTATKKLGAARDFLAAGQWQDAIDLLLQVGETHGETLTPVTPKRFVNVRAYCDLLLAGLPAAGLDRLRDRLDPQAKRWLEAARERHDDAELVQIVEQAFLSRSTPEALFQLGERAWDRGDLSLARRYWRRLLPLAEAVPVGRPAPLAVCPDAPHNPAAVRVRLLMCAIMQGNPSRAQRELERFAELHPEATGRLAGKSGLYVDLLRDQIARLAVWSELRPAARDIPLTDAATFAGHPARNDREARPIDVGALRWSVPLNPITPEVPGRVANAFFRQGGTWITNSAASVNVGAVPAYFPVVAGNKVFVCDEWRIFGFDLATGQPAFPGKKTYGLVYEIPEENRPRFLASRPVVGAPRFTLTVSGNVLYARLGVSTTGRVPPEPDPAPALSFLVALDLAREGQLVYSLDARTLATEGQRWIWDGPPVVLGERAFTVLRQGGPRPQLNVVCLDAATGAPRWNRRVCLGSEPFTGGIHEITHTLLTAGDRQLFLNTHLGAVAALDQQSGRIDWVSLYRHADAENTRVYAHRHKRDPHPCLYHDGLVIAAPTDSNEIVALDAETGLTRWTLALPDQPRTLLGVRHGRLIVSGDRLWGIEADTGRVLWPGPGEQPYPADPETYGFGRGALAGDVVYWPRREDVVVVDLRNGLPVRIPFDLRVGHALQGGNLTLTPRGLLLASPDRLTLLAEQSAPPPLRPATAGEAIEKRFETARGPTARYSSRGVK